MKTEKGNEHSLHLTDHAGKEHNEDCIFCLAENGKDEVSAYILLVGEEYATKEGFDESYQGQFSSDEDFARDMAENLGEIPKENHWPHYCIDWEWAARELMMDYSVENGHYFRNF